MRGRDESKVCRTKAQAVAWAQEVEREIKEGVQERKTLADAFVRYRDEVSPGKRGHRWEYVRLNRFLQTIRWAQEPIAAITVPQIAEWRDDRLKEVSGASVRRELNLLSAVFEIARREWQWVRENPVRDVRKPQGSPHRTRRISQEEIDRICFALGHDPGSSPTAKTQQVAVAFLLAIETAMRAGEILGVERGRVDYDRRVVSIPRTKNGHPRTVPLSDRAVELLQSLPSQGPLFDLSSASLDALFRKYVKRAGVTGLTFHDSRREATSRLAKKVDVLTLAKITGHRNISELLTYYETDMADVARALQTTPQPATEDNDDHPRKAQESQGDT